MDRRPEGDGSRPGTAGDYSPIDDFHAYTQAGYKRVQKGVIASQKLPDSDAYKFYTTYPNFVETMKNEAKNILDAIQLVLDYAKISGRIADMPFDETIDVVVEANDTLLDRSTHNMDVLEGFREATATTESTAAQQVENTFHKKLSGTWNRPPEVVPAAAAAAVVPSRQQQQQQHQDANARSAPSQQQHDQPSLSSFTLHMAKVTTRPQVFFKDKINNQNEPWIPRIKEKPNNLKPLSILLEVDEEGYESYSHPYEYELERWSPSPEQLERIPVVRRPAPIEETPYDYVETDDDLARMTAELDGETEIAVDLEHHSYRSFMGFTCLMQISTRTKDYLIDTLTLRDRLYALNEIFTKPTVLKVFHGATSDIDWLQRDLSLYVVNMFDTYQAAKVLQFPKLNLAYLLKRYCDVDANKQFQLYDWRTRPLSDNALKYARIDTHYLIYIYSCMSNELLAKANGNTNLLRSVYQLSTETCKRKYAKPLLEADSHVRLYRKSKRSFNNRQMYALERLYRWADAVARDDDESMGYVLPSHMMMQIAENLPREMQGILACCNPIPPLVRQHVNTLHNIVQDARNQPLVKVVDEERVVAQPLVSGLAGGQSLSDRLFDVKHCEFRDDLPTVIDGTLVVRDPDDPEGGGGGDDEDAVSGRMWTDEPLLPIYQEDEDDTVITHSKKVMKNWNDIENQKLLKPYQRYKMVLPYVNQMEREQRDREETEYRLREQKRREEEEERNRTVYRKDTVSFSVKEQEKIAEKIEVDDAPLAAKGRKKKGGRKRGVGGDGVDDRDDDGKKKKKKCAAAAQTMTSATTTTKQAESSTPQRQQEQRQHSTEYGVINTEINTTVGGGTRRRNDTQADDSQKFTPFDYRNTNFDKFSGGVKQLQLQLRSDNNGTRKKQKKKKKKGRNGPGNEESTDRVKSAELGIKKSVWFKRKAGRGGHRQQQQQQQQQY